MESRIKKLESIFLVIGTIASAPISLGQWSRIPHPGADLRCVTLSDSSITVVGSFGNWHTSRDLGASWLTPTRNYDAPSAVFYSVRSFTGQTYIGGSDGLIMSGTTDVSPRPTGISSDVLTFADASDSLSKRVLAGTFGEGIIASSDGGMTWAAFGTGLGSQNVTSLLVTHLAATGSAAHVLAATYGAGIHRSIDGGLTWVAANQGITVLNINQLCSAAGYIFAAASGGHFYASGDSGKSWENIGLGLPETEILSLGVRISASDTVCLAGTIDAGIWVRSLRGGPWAAKNIGLQNLRINSIAVWDSLVLAGTHEGAYLSADRGMTWNLVSKPAFPRVVAVGAAVDAGNPLKTHLFVGSAEWLYLGHCPYSLGRAFTSSNMGDNWEVLPFTYVRSFPSVFVRDSVVVFAREGSVDCSGPVCYVSSDLGRSWRYERSYLRAMGVSMKAYEKEGNSGVNLFLQYYGPYAGMFFSPDTDRTWHRLGDSSFRFPLAVSGMNIYCRAYPGYVRSTDFGNTWQDFTQHLGGAQISELETHGTKLFGASNCGLLLSVDSAQTWSTVGFHNVSIPAIATHDSLLFIVAHGELYYSKDSSLTWANVAENLRGDSVYRVACSENHCFVSTSGGRTLWYRPLSEIVAIPGPRPDAPTLLSPRADSVVSFPSVQFVWSKPDFTRDFQFQLSRDSTFVTSNVIDSSGIADTALVVGQLASGISYFWRVRSSNINGPGVWSSVFSFQTSFVPTGIPILVTPADSALNLLTEVRLVWRKAFSAEQYQLQVWSVVNGFPSYTVNDSAVVDTQRVADTLRTGTWYSWRVRGRNASGYGQWSAVRHFRTIVHQPFQVNLVFPENGATVTGDSIRLLCNWTGPEVFCYWFECATDSLFVYRQVDSTVTDTIWTLRGLLGGRKYWWRVRARNLAGYGPFSEIRTFWVSVTGLEEQGEIPKEYALSQNHPNPFNPTTTIEYGLPRRSQVTLVVFNTLGQQVETLVQGEEEAGYHSIDFNASNLSSGVYFYCLQAGDFMQTRKLLLMK